MTTMRGRLLDESTPLSYCNDLPQLSDDSFRTELSPITSPKKAFSMQLPSRLKLQPASSELTPPPSPPANEYNESRRESVSSLFNRASSAISSRRQSISPVRASPVRTANASPSRSPLRSPILEDDAASSASIASPNGQRASKAAAAVADFFQGSSELVPGFTASSKRQDSYAPRLRPGHSRKNSAMSVAASFFGRNSPTKQFRDIEEEDDEEDDITRLDIDHELFPHGEPQEVGLPDFDDLKGNAERLFMHMQMAYQVKLNELRQQRATDRTQQQDLEDAEARASHLKSQLQTVSQEQAEKIRQLEMELEQERSLRQAEVETRMRSVRMVSKHTQPSLSEPGSDGHRLFSGDREDGLYSLSQAGYDSSAESLGGSAEGSKCWSPLDTPLSASRPESPARPGWPDLGAANLMEQNLALKAEIAALKEGIDAALCLDVFAGL